MYIQYVIKYLGKYVLNLIIAIILFIFHSKIHIYCLKKSSLLTECEENYSINSKICLKNTIW